MAQTKRKRRNTKHRGNAAGIVEHRGRTSRPPSPEARKAQRKDSARQARGRYAKPPSWRSAANRALVTSVLFVAVVVLAFKQPAASAIALGAFKFLQYIPIGYYTDAFFYNKRQQNLAKKGKS